MDKAIFQNECAMVEVRRDESANGVRLLIRDLATGNHIYLDPLELEALTRLDHDFFLPLVAPARREKVPLDDALTSAPLRKLTAAQAAMAEKGVGARISRKAFRNGPYSPSLRRWETRG